MDNLYTTILSLFLCSMLTLAVSAQDVEPADGERSYPTYNYSVQVNCSSLIFSNQLILGLERKIWQRNNFRSKAKLFHNYFINNDFDFAAGERIYKTHTGIALVQMIGLLELNAGVSYSSYRPALGFFNTPTTYVDETQYAVGFYGNVGMRFELNKILLRFGLGNLDHFYGGIGYSF